LVRKLEDHLGKKRGKNGVVRTEPARSKSVTHKSASPKPAKTKSVKSKGVTSTSTRSKSSRNGTYSTDGTEHGPNLNIVGLAGMEDHSRAGYPLPRGIGPDRFMPEPRATSRPAEAYSQFRSTRVIFGLDSVKGRPAPIIHQGYHQELSEEGSSGGGKSK
jgi:hypothetical protein